MFDLGWTEMMLIGVVALIVVGPKELPTLFRAVGQAVGKARGMAREFSRAMEAAADEAGVKEINRQITAATRPVQFATDRLKEGMKPRPAIPAAGTPIASGEVMAPLDPGQPLAAGPVASSVPEVQAVAVAAPAPSAPLSALKPGGATEALMVKRAEERAALAAAHAPVPAPTPTPDEAP